MAWPGTQNPVSPVSGVMISWEWVPKPLREALQADFPLVTRISTERRRTSPRKMGRCPPTARKAFKPRAAAVRSRSRKELWGGRPPQLGLKVFEGFSRCERKAQTCWPRKQNGSSELVQARSWTSEAYIVIFVEQMIPRTRA